MLACSSQAPMVSVPDLYSLMQTQAEKSLESAGLKAAYDLQGPCPSIPGPHEPKVTDQKPDPGTKAAKGSVVHLHVC